MRILQFILLITLISPASAFETQNVCEAVGERAELIVQARDADVGIYSIWESMRIAVKPEDYPYLRRTVALIYLYPEEINETNAKAVIYNNCGK